MDWMTLRNKSVIFFLCVLVLTLFESAKSDNYLAIGPSLGYYQTNDTVARFNDVIKVRGRAKLSQFAFEISVGHKNEIYKKDIVWVKSWPIQLSASYYPFSFLYVSAGAGLYELYIDYNQQIDELTSYENESKRRFGSHVAIGLERQISKTVSVLLECNQSWIDYDFRPILGNKNFDTNSIAVEAALQFRLGVDD